MEQIIEKFNTLTQLNEVDATKMQQWKDLESSMGRNDMVKEIKQVYHSSTLEIVEAMQFLLKTNDTMGLKRQCHKMKSGCGNLGFHRLQKMCEFSENLLMNPLDVTDEDIEHIFKTINQECHRSLVLLETL